MEFTKEEFIQQYNSKTENYSTNPKTKRRIKKNGPVYKKLEKEYKKMK